MLFIHIYIYTIMFGCEFAFFSEMPWDSSPLGEYCLIFFPTIVTGGFKDFLFATPWGNDTIWLYVDKLYL